MGIIFIRRLTNVIRYCTLYKYYMIIFIKYNYIIQSLQNYFYLRSVCCIVFCKTCACSGYLYFDASCCGLCQKQYLCMLMLSRVLVQTPRIWP